MPPSPAGLTRVEQALVRALASAIVKVLRAEDDTVSRHGGDVCQQGTPSPRGDQPTREGSR